MKEHAPACGAGGAATGRPVLAVRGGPGDGGSSASRGVCGDIAILGRGEGFCGENIRIIEINMEKRQGIQGTIVKDQSGQG